MPNPQTIEIPQKQSSTADWETIAESIAVYLRAESAFLDRMIAINQYLQRLVKDRDLRTKLQSNEPCSGPERQQQWLQQVDLLRQQIDQHFQSIRQGRGELSFLLKRLSASSASSPSLVEIAVRLKSLKSPLGDELLRLRREIQTQLRELDTISVANQAVLVYTLDHHQRMLVGMMGNQSPESMHSQSYNAQGQMLTVQSGNLLEKQC